MGKLGGLAVLVAAAVSLSACAGAVEPSTSASAEPSSAPSGIAPLFAAPAETSATATPTPTPTATLPPEFYDDSARAKYLAGVKKALNAWRDGVIPSDEDLLKGADAACRLFAQGKSYVEIGDLAGSTESQKSNGVAVAVYASRFLCTKYNTDNL